MYFNECNNMAFHDLSRNRVATSTHNLTSLLGLGEKFCPQGDLILFKNSEAMLARSRKNVRTRWFILTNSHSDSDAVSPRLHRKIFKWEPSRACRSIKGTIDRLD